MFVNRADDRDLVDHFQVEPAVDEGVGFLRVVGEQPDFAQAEVFQQLDADAVVARIGFVTEREVRFDGVEALVLQRVGFDLFGDADAPPLLRQVNEHASAFALDHIERHVQLVAAIAAERFEQIAGKA